MCNHKCQCCGPCCCCKDHVETAFILGLSYIISNVLFFEMLQFVIIVDNFFTLIYLFACKIFHPIQYAVLIFAAYKRSSTAILVWIILTAIICSLHFILGKIIYSYIIAKFFKGGYRTKMKIRSENFSRASGAQKKGVPKFFACGGLFSSWRH